MKGVTQHAGVPMPLDQGGSELKLQSVCVFQIMVTPGDNDNTQRTARADSPPSA